jgi:hypothetical protein
MKTPPKSPIKLSAIVVLLLLAPLTGYSFYNPSTGRWLSRDPGGERAARNLYAYPSNDPVMVLDYLGECATTCMAKSVKLAPIGWTKQDDSRPPNSGDFYHFRVAVTEGTATPSGAACCKLIQWVNVRYSYRTSAGDLYLIPSSPGGVPYDGKWHIDSVNYGGDNPCSVKPVGGFYPFGGDDYPGFIIPKGQSFNGNFVSFSFSARAEVRDTCQPGCPIVVQSNQLDISMNGQYPNLTRKPPE